MIVRVVGWREGRCTELVVDDKAKTVTLGGKTFRAGDWISLNGNTGEIIEGREALVRASERARGSG